jgi:hypothetical protein
MSGPPPRIAPVAPPAQVAAPRTPSEETMLFGKPRTWDTPDAPARTDRRSSRRSVIRGDEPDNAPDRVPDRTPVVERRRIRPAAAALLADLPHRRHSKIWMYALSTLGVLVLLSVCGLGTFFMIKDERAGTVAARQETVASAGPTARPRDISTRDVDPKPLTEQEVFPKQTFAVAGSDQAYQVLKTQQSQDCRIAATEQLNTLLVKLGCSQVVRGTLKAPNGQFLVTSGIFNLKDEAGATQFDAAVKPTVDAGKGRLIGLLAGNGTEPVLRAPTHLGWFARGHFIAYCVIARVDGKAIAADDPLSRQIATDLVETHLRDDIIGARAVQLIGTPTPGKTG